MQKFTCGRQVLPYLQQLYGRKNMQEVERYDLVLNEFKQKYGYDSAYLCSSSGRVEFIGNHTDHNGGRVVGCTVSLDIIAAFCPNGKNEINVVGTGRSEINVKLDDNANPLTGSEGLIKGVVEYLLSQGYNVGGFDAYTDSTVPSGAGVSSSAAFETAIGVIISELFNEGRIPVETLARAGQYAECEYFDKPCGLLDQSVVAAGGFVALDFADGLSYNTVDADFSKLQLVLIDNGVSHSNLSPLYAAIPAEMKDVAAFFGKERLIEIDEKTFFEHYDDVQKTVGLRPALRAKHFYEENRRVDEIKLALSSGDVDKTLELVNASGDSSLYQLQNCAVDDKDTAIEDIIHAARGLTHSAARVHGGGFAGTVLCVIPTANAADFIAKTTEIYGSDKVLPLRLRTVGAKVL